MKNYCQNIRNFCIIAHIDHGKSTLADRFLEITQLISERNMKAQYLDSLALEIERGITIKLKTIQLNYLSASNGETYTLNLIDTPGHVDFHHEVRQTIRACEGAILLIDAVQGIQAQTIANAQLAIARGLNIIPVINKIDLPHAQADVVQQQIKQLLPTITRSALLISAKTGLHVDRLLEVIVSEITPPVNESTGLLQALIFDSYYDQYKGVVLLVRVFRGTIRLQEDIKLMNTNMRYRVVEMGVQTDHRAAVNILSSGQVGWLTANIKKFHQVYRGDTITHFHHPALAPLPGFTRPQQVIFCNLFPVDSRQFLLLKNTIARLSLEDSGIIYQPVNSSALGAGFNCGFLGLLHMEIFQERVQREGKLTLVITAPTVNYRVFLKKKPQTATIINNPIYWPPVTHIHQIEEP